MMSPLIVIPARRHSTRLADKLLLRETGKPVLQHTVERALEAAAHLATGTRPADLVWVVCDDEELAKAAAAAGVRSVMVTAYCESGTERIFRALPALPRTDVIVNLQADEPELPVNWLAECAAACSGRPATDVTTIAVPMTAADPALNDPNAVKVVCDHQGFALYFSRAPIPALREGGRPPSPRALRHVGLYAYSASFLRRYAELPPSDLELCECLEQLRFLQAGARIKVLLQDEQHHHVRGIDTRDDYRQFVERIRGSRKPAN